MLNQINLACTDKGEQENEQGDGGVAFRADRLPYHASGFVAVLSRPSLRHEALVPVRAASKDCRFGVHAVDQDGFTETDSTVRLPSGSVPLGHIDGFVAIFLDFLGPEACGKSEEGDHQDGAEAVKADSDLRRERHSALIFT
jgi:hypothetical protein